MKGASEMELAKHVFDNKDIVLLFRSTGDFDKLGKLEFYQVYYGDAFRLAPQSLSVAHSPSHRLCFPIDKFGEAQNYFNFLVEAFSKEIVNYQEIKDIKTRHPYTLESFKQCLKSKRKSI
jgi:hypothetical protein